MVYPKKISIIFTFFTLFAALLISCQNTPTEDAKIPPQTVQTPVQETPQPTVQRAIEPDVPVPPAPSENSSAPKRTTNMPANANTAQNTFGEVAKQSATVEIQIKNFAFLPETITIDAGDQVTWTNEDSSAHTISSNSFTSDSIATGQSYTFKFDKPGTYDYSCGIHPSMRGTIIVK